MTVGFPELISSSKVEKMNKNRSYCKNLPTENDYLIMEKLGPSLLEMIHGT